MGGEYGKRMRMGDGKTPEGFYYTYIPDESTSIQIYRVPKGDTLVKDALMSGIIIHSGCISSDGSIAIADSSFAELRWLLGKQGYVSTLILPFEDDGEYRDRAIVQSVRSNPAEFRHIWFVRALNIIAKGKWFPITMEPGDYATIVSGVPEYTWEYFVDYLPPLIDIPYRAAMLAE